MVTATIGILALQGAFESHAHALQRLGAESRTVRTAAELAAVDALVLPGGESSAMLRLMESEELDLLLRSKIDAGMPVLATCAGVILLAAEVDPEQTSLGLLNVAVKRNAYGRQVHSSVEVLKFEGSMDPPQEAQGILIRAPRIVRTGSDVTTLAWLRNDPVLVQQGTIIAATYHPELSEDLRVHQRFLNVLENG